MRRFNAIATALLVILAACKNGNSENKVPGEEKTKLSVPPKIVDLTHSFSDETVYWVTSREFELDTVFEGHTDKGYYYSAFNFTTAEHGGTHLDAPIHFAENRQSVDQVPLEKLVGPAVKIDVSSNALNNRDYLITKEDFIDWETKNNMQLPQGVIVLLETGHSRYYPDKEKYLGTAKRGEAAVKKLHFPGISTEAANWLVEERNINAIGIDTPSIDYGQSEDFESHVILLGQNIPAFENLTNLEELPAYGFQVVALPMKIEGGSGAPLRIIALLEH
ncbi:cyclase family protein [Poritiphilus flavus]|uniref:Cyclase family protein n=1 Tax=Poritiphilus flavus TaxID=2697053 RepID=A0A6L9EFZ2_9FLAO|nr:cyclase family protein [Poritiphilus flavus]NAS13596.1 cyclase family protein [Poritiphilus flavus]